ncbi:MAG: hypothetical protein AAGF87_00445 [Bacteroidota bacterium]
MSKILFIPLSYIFLLLLPLSILISNCDNDDDDTDLTTLAFGVYEGNLLGVDTDGNPATASGVVATVSKVSNSRISIGLSDGGVQVQTVIFEADMTSSTNFNVIPFVQNNVTTSGSGSINGDILSINLASSNNTTGSYTGLRQ